MKIAYITTSLGSLSHTFIRREVIELRALGVEISLFGIRPDKAKELSDREKGLTDETAYLYPLKLFAVIKGNMYFIFHKSHNYFKALSNALTNEETGIFQHLKLIYHFFVSCYTALKIEKIGARHIHAHFLNVPATIAMYCSELTGIPFSISAHSAGIAHLKEMIGLKAKIKKAAFIRTISDYNKEYISKNIFPCSEKIHVIRCGINLADYKVDSVKKPPLRHCEEDSIKPHSDEAIQIFVKDKVKLISIGRFVEKKGFRYVIESANLLKADGVLFGLTLIGDGPLKKELEDLAKGYNLYKEVAFTGYISQEEVYKELIDSDIIVIPSVEAKSGEKEGIPVTIMEAMAAGVFVIATDHSGIPEVVKDKETGLLVREMDPKAIASAIKLAKEDDVLRKTCIHNARRLVEEEFDIRKTAESMKRLFEENI